MAQSSINNLSALIRDLQDHTLIQGCLPEDGALLAYSALLSCKHRLIDLLIVQNDPVDCLVVLGRHYLRVGFISSVLILLLIGRVAPSGTLAARVKRSCFDLSFASFGLVYEFERRDETATFEFFLHFFALLLSARYDLLVEVTVEVLDFFLVKFIGALEVPETASDVAHTASD